MVFPPRLKYLTIMKTKHIFLFTLLALASAGTVFADLRYGDLQSGNLRAGANPQVLTVDSAVQIALENNLSLRRMALNTAAMKRAADRSWNSLLPTVSAGAMVSRPTSITGEIFPLQAMGPDGRVIDRNVWTPGFSFSTQVTFSTAVIENIRRAEADYAAGLLSYEAARQELELNVRRLFYHILLLDANRELAAQNFASAQARYEQSAALARAGQVPHLDEFSARVDMENMRPAVRNAEIIYENALDSFKAILGLPSDTVIRLEGSLGVTLNGGFSGIHDPPRGNRAIGECLETARLRKSIQSMEAQRNAIRNSAYVPSLRLAWNSTPLYNIQNNFWTDNGSFSITLGLNIDNFLPWSVSRTQMDALNDQIQSTHIQLADSLRSRENRVNQNMRTIGRILESLEATKLNIELAQTTYDMFGEAYRGGAVDYQRLRSARDGLEQAKNRLLQEQFNLISATLDLERELNIPFGTIIYGAPAI